MRRIALLLGLAVSLCLARAVTAQQNGSSNASDCNGGCDVGCNSGDCGGDHGCVWYAGVEATYLKLQPTKNRVLFEDDNDDKFLYSFEAAPRIWFGVQDDCSGCGLRLRYWQYDAEAHHRDIDSLDFEDPDIDFRVAASEFELYDIDLEVTKRCTCGCWDLLFSGGYRYAYIRHTYVGNDIEFDGEGDTGFFALSRRKNGSGITAAMEAWRPIGDECSPFSVFASFRASVIWGSNSAQALLIAIEDDDFDGDEWAGQTRNQDTMTIFEAQLGAQWSQRIACMGYAQAFVRGAFEYQNWNLHRQSGLEQFVGNTDDDNLRVDALGRGDVNLYGIAISAGIQY